MSSRVIEAFSQYFDDAGDPLMNGWMEFLYSGTNNTKKDTYTDDQMTVPNANPLQLDAAGRIGNVFGTGIYKAILYQNDPVTNTPGQQVQEFDPIQSQAVTAGAGEQFEEWDATTEYSADDIVLFNSRYYKSISDSNTGNAPDTETAWWEEIDFIHTWNAEVTYVTNQVAVYDTQIYTSLQDGNKNNQPDISPAYWDPVGSGTVLFSWEESGTTFQPVSPGGFDIGASPNNLVGDIYMGDGAHLYLGDGQDANIEFNGSVLSILSNTGMSFTVDGDGTAKAWAIQETDGTIYPSSPFDIGSASFPIDDLYSTGKHYFGATQQGVIDFDGTNFILYTTTTAPLVLGSNNNPFWAVSSSGDFYPWASGYDLGTISNLIGNLFMTSGVVYLDYSTPMYLAGNSPPNITMLAGTAGVITLAANAGATVNGNFDFGSDYFRPQSNNGTDLGGTTNYWKNVYAQVVTLAADPVNPLEAATKQYADASGGGALNYWTEDGAGNLTPDGASQDFGSTTSPVDNIFANVFESGGGSSVLEISTSGNIGIINASDILGTLEFQINSVTQWEIDNNGDLNPTSDQKILFNTTDGALWWSGGAVNLRSSGSIPIYIGSHITDLGTGTTAMIRFYVPESDGLSSFEAWRIIPGTGDLICLDRACDVGSTTYPVSIIFPRNIYMVEGTTNMARLSLDTSNDFNIQTQNATGIRNWDNLHYGTGPYQIKVYNDQAFNMDIVSDTATGRLGAGASVGARLQWGNFGVRIPDSRRIYWGTDDDAQFYWDNGSSELRIEPTVDNNETIKIGRNVMNWSAIYINATSSIYLYTGDSITIQCNSGGEVWMPKVYSDTVTGRDLYIASNGKLGYVASTIENKLKIKKLKDKDLSWIYQLIPQEYEFDPAVVDGAIEGEKEFGLIAEEVELVYPDLVDYDVDPETQVKTPATIKHRNLTALLLQEIHNLNERITQLEAV